MHNETMDRPSGGANGFQGCVQTVTLVTLVGFLIMDLLAYYKDTGQPPIPTKFVDQNGQLAPVRAGPSQQGQDTSDA